MFESRHGSDHFLRKTFYSTYNPNVMKNDELLHDSETEADLEKSIYGVREKGAVSC